LAPDLNKLFFIESGRARDSAAAAFVVFEKLRPPNPVPLRDEIALLLFYYRFTTQTRRFVSVAKRPFAGCRVITEGVY
jgi:hypothetical protein